MIVETPVNIDLTKKVLDENAHYDGVYFEDMSDVERRKFSAIYFDRMIKDEGAMDTAKNLLNDAINSPANGCLNPLDEFDRGQINVIIEWSLYDTIADHLRRIINENKEA